MIPIIITIVVKYLCLGLLPLTTVDFVASTSVFKWEAGRQEDIA